jgi:hypothetical protein
MGIAWITKEEAENLGDKEERVLLEQTPGHYPEFDAFLSGELERGGGALFFRGDSGTAYRVGWADKGPTELGGVEICVRVFEGKPVVAPETIDLDLWPFFEWLVAGVGGEWTLDALRKTGAIYRVPGAPERA